LIKEGYEKILQTDPESIEKCFDEKGNEIKEYDLVGKEKFLLSKMVSLPYFIFSE